MAVEKTYLGDGVYAEVDHDMIKITSYDGVSITNTIYLEPSVYTGLVKFALSLEKESGRDHLQKSFDAFLDLYVHEGGILDNISIADMIKWCSARCGHKTQVREVFNDNG